MSFRVCHRRRVALAIACVAVMALAGGLSLPAVPAHARPAQQPPRTWSQYLPHVAYAAALAPGDVPGAPTGCGTGIAVVNLDPANAAQLTATFHRQDGLESLTVDETVPPGAVADVYLPGITHLHTGLYAVALHADRPIAAMARTDCVPSGKAAEYSAVEPSTDVVVPLAVKNYYGQCSVVSIQNTDPTISASALLTPAAVGSAPGSQPGFVREIGPGTSRTLDLCTDPEIAAVLPDGFVGSLRVQASNGTTRLAVQSYVDIRTSRQALYAFEGVPLEAASRELYVPLFRSRQPLNRNDPATRYMDTGLSVMALGGTDQEVTVTYYGAQGAAACVGGVFTQTAKIPALSSAVFYQGPATQPVTGRHPLPDNCVGSARITAPGGLILAVVNDTLNLTDQSAAYNALPGERASTRVALPLFRTGHTWLRLWTGISVMNVGSGAASTTLAARSRDGTVTAGLTDMSIHGVAPLHTALFWPTMVQQSGPPWSNQRTAYGMALVTSDQPAVAIVNDTSQSGSVDAATYTGIGWEE